MVVYRPLKKDVLEPKNDCNCHIDNETIMDNNCCPPPHPHPHPFPPIPPHPCEPVITISVDGDTTDVKADVLYGPPGKDGTINGYNKVDIEGGSNIIVDEREEILCHNRKKNILTINSTTYVEDTDNSNIEYYFEQAKPKSIWIIQHGLKKYPSVTVVDRDTKKEIICEVRYVSENEIHLLFNGKFRGYAYLN